MATVKTKNNIVSVLGTRFLNQSTFVLKIERGGLAFGAGQYISLGLPGKAEKREYSIYSGEEDVYLEVLVKEIESGLVSRQLRNLQDGAHLEMDGPFGFFTLKQENKRGSVPVLIASGTGIAPFHSFVRSNPGLDYRLIHGVRYAEEAYDRETYEGAPTCCDPGGKRNYLLCTSGDENGDYHGRVTDYLRENPQGTGRDYYLCGNSKMIHDVYGILRGQGVDTERIHAEVYF